MSRRATIELSEHDDWIDVTVPIRREMTRLPGSPAVGVLCDERTIDARGGVCRVTTLTLGAHTGTHANAPIHFGVSRAGVDALPIGAFIGPARVIALAHAKKVHVPELESLSLSAGERVLLKTRNSEKQWSSSPFNPDFVHMTPEAARWFAARRIALLGFDYLSLGETREGHEAHRVLLEAGVCILEGLDSTKIRPGSYDLVALPLRLEGADGAPARAVLRSRQGHGHGQARQATTS